MAQQGATSDIARLMEEFRAGQSDAARDLVPLFEPELRRMAVARLRRERPEHTLQPTALVNELYLELLKMGRLRAGSGDSNVEREEFLRLCAFLMRRLLIRHARPLSKRVEKTEIDNKELSARPPVELLADIERALERLSAIDPKLRQVVEMKVFEGLSQEEIAVRLNCSLRTASRHWSFARQWLESELGPLLG
jgi:RNA polymerase sigma factor (TIGR02999 family)